MTVLLAALFATVDFYISHGGLNDCKRHVEVSSGFKFKFKLADYLQVYATDVLRCDEAKLSAHLFKTK